MVDVVWRFEALPGLVGGGLMLVMAWFVYAVRPSRWQNRWLALLMASVAMGTLASTARFLVFPDLVVSTGLYFSGQVLYLIGVAFAWAFLGTLPLAWTRPLRRPVGLAAVLGVHGVLAFCYVAFPQVVTTGLTPSDSLPILGSFTGLWLSKAASLEALLCGVVGSVACLMAYRRMANGIERAKVRALAAAFVSFAFLILLPTLLGIVRLRGALYEMTNFYGIPLAEFVFSALLSYGMLKAQLFDFDRKLKWTISRSTLAGIFVAVFLIVSQIAQNYLSNLGNSLWIGGIVTGLVLFAINPLQKFAERIGAAAVPGASPEAIEGRKEQLFRAALEGALEDGVITKRETAMLTRLQLELGISNAEAKRLEGELRAEPVI